jgi:hypothetical protein
LREDLTLRRDTSGDKFHIELDKQTLDNRDNVGFDSVQFERLKMR